TTTNKAPTACVAAARRSRFSTQPKKFGDWTTKAAVDSSRVERSETRPDLSSKGTETISAAPY
ncbi:MAG: hypothetical protein ABIV48_04985, partial [Pyrinomonadaceae bacterium]